MALARVDLAIRPKTVQTRRLDGSPAVMMTIGVVLEHHLLPTQKALPERNKNLAGHLASGREPLLVDWVLIC